MIRGRGREEGVEVEYRGERMIHSFFTMEPVSDGAVQAQTLTCGAIRRAFAQVA